MHQKIKESMAGYSFNYYGTYTLFVREVKRFLKVYHQTLIAPAVSALIFLSIFVLALGDVKSEVKGVKFIDFMGIGLIIMTIVQNSFSNSSSSLIMSKVIGYINDILMPPLGSLEIIIAFSLGAITRGIICGLLVAGMLYFFIDYQVYSLGALIYFTLSSCFCMALVGIFSGIAANTFDQNSAITSYLITPLSFLSGTFYSVERLPEFFQKINMFNPFFYMIDGFRYSLTGYNDSDLSFGVLFLLICNVALFLALHVAFSKGWRIKS